MRFLLLSLLIFIALYTVLTVVRGVLGPGTPPPTRGGRRQPTAGKLVKDPVCGTYVAEETALRSGNQFFCSEECRSKFG